MQWMHTTLMRKQHVATVLTCCQQDESKIKYHKQDFDISKKI